MNAGRKYLNTSDLCGKVFLTSGLGGMSGAQAKAAVIAGCIGVIAEVSGVYSETSYPREMINHLMCTCTGKSESTLKEI